MIDRISTRLGLSKETVHVISAVNIGNILEWFEVYSFAYLAPILSKLFFKFDSPLENMFFTFLLFGVGFLARPIGGIYFGRMGDKKGRKSAFVRSIIFLTAPTFVMGILPTYESWGIYAPISLFILRSAQSFSTGGELPGTICYLYENSKLSNRRFITSWNAFGNQIGAIVGIAESFLMENYLSNEFMMSWGWRLSFLSGGCIGLFAIYLRHTLHETPVFERLKKTHKIDSATVKHLWQNYKKVLAIGIAFGAIDAASFYLLATYVPAFLDQQLGVSMNINFGFSALLLLVSTILLPIFGRLGDKFSNRNIFISCAILILILLYPLNIFMQAKNLPMLILLSLLFILPITFITALIACLFGDLFPANLRFTGLGISMNICDGIIGGFAPAVALILLQFVHHQWAFNWYILGCGIISLVSYMLFIKKPISQR